MEDWESYILSGVFFLLLCLCWFLWRWKKRGKNRKGNFNFILTTLEQAQSQYEIFNLKPLKDGEARAGIAALLKRIDRSGLHLTANDYISTDLKGVEVDVYFKVKQPEGPVFHVFRSSIRQVQSNYEESSIALAFPEHLRIEKKRHFMRVSPNREDVRVIGVWPLEPGKKLPKSTDDIGSPITHFKPGMKDAPVQLENVSASGLALRFRLDENGKAPMDWKVGGQMLCLVVYDQSNGAERPTAFWCTGEIMNSRIAEGAKPTLILGLEFTNWAVLEQGKGEIHWAHSSPSRGAKPILQWVEKIEQGKNAE